MESREEDPPHHTRNLKRTVSTLMVSIGLTLVTTAGPALAGGSTWAG